MMNDPIGTLLYVDNWVDMHVPRYPVSCANCTLVHPRLLGVNLTCSSPPVYVSTSPDKAPTTGKTIKCDLLTNTSAPNTDCVYECPCYPYQCGNIQVMWRPRPGVDLDQSLCELGEFDFSFISSLLSLFKFISHTTDFIINWWGQNYWRYIWN